jgi:hypothetical protein
LGEADETYSDGMTLTVAVGIAVCRRHIVLCRRLQAVGVELWPRSEYVCVSITDPGIGVRLDEICTSKLLSVT